MEVAPALMRIPIEGEAALLVIIETLLRHRIWLKAQQTKKSDD